MKLTKSSVVEELVKARNHLLYSFNKAQKISLHNELQETELETLESFSGRFSRFSDISIAKYFRLLCLEADPAFRGSVADIKENARAQGPLRSGEGLNSSNGFI
jgi:hypothetical protein